MPERQDESMPATSTPELESGSTNTILATPESSGAAGSSAHPQSSHQPEYAPAEPITVPKNLDLDSLQDLTLYELSELGHRLNVRVHADKSRHHLVFDLCKSYIERGCEITASAIVDINAQGGAFLRWGRYNFRPLPQDIQVPYHFDRQFRLQPGLQATVRVRAPRERERFLQVEEFLSIEGIPASDWQEPKDFERLTAMHPNARIVLENEQTRSISPRAVDLIAPLGRGQRGLLVAPPRTGKTILLKEIAQAIQNTSPETKLILLLVDERPEEVTDFRRALNCEIYSSTFDENAQRHTQVAEMVLERAKRLVELHHHVVILLDSITRLSRGYNNLQPGKGRIMSGGVDAKALIKPKKFFGAARNTEEGGSLTILATALVETHSKMDDLIFEEFKGTGNMELRLDRTLSEKRVFPAINLPQSGTRRDELLYHPKEFERISALRRQLAGLPAMEATEVLNQALRNTTSNAELLLKGMRA
jgi:transcription termination factor Rho